MLLNFLSKVFLPPWLAKTVTLVIFRSLVNACAIPLIGKTLPHVLIITPRQIEITYSLG